MTLPISRISRPWGRQPLGRRRLLSAAWQVALVTLVIAGVVTLLTAFLRQKNGFMFDFRGDLYSAGRSILDGTNPYRFHFIESLVALKRAGGDPSSTFAVPVYPPPVLLVFVPFSLLPFWLDGALFVIASSWAVVAGLRMLGVRDWRCLVVALLSFPSVFAIYIGTLSPWLVLAAGTAWRYREGLWTPSTAIASAVMSKLFPWPLGFWLLATRRFGALALSIALILGCTLVAWALIGFDGMSSYPRMLSDLSYIEDPHGISLLTILRDNGASSATAWLIVIAATTAMLTFAWSVAGRADGDRRAFGLVTMAALTASPLIWPHYWILIFVPIALMSPRWSALWAAPLLLYLSSSTPTASSWREMIPWLAMQVIVLARLCIPGVRRPDSVASGRRDGCALQEIVPARTEQAELTAVH